MRRVAFVLPLVVAGGLAAFPAEAQAQAPIAGCRSYRAEGGLRVERSPSRQLLIGSPEAPWRIECDEVQFFADTIELLSEPPLVRATGHVLFVSGGSRISADRMEFDTTTRTGTFYHASATLALGDRVDRSLFGAQEPDAFLYGETVEKLGPKKYRLTRGGFTTCVQPTPRWELVSSTVTITLDEYALLRNAVFRVKGVPLLYLPAIYYPVQEDDRATGFLMPIYGSGNLQGHSIKNAFFWAINRSHDATFYHDWFSKAGQGFGGEYRYALAPRSHGTGSVYVIDEREVLDAQAAGGIPPIPAKRSYEVRGSVAQRLPGGLHARGDTNWFSSVTTMQWYRQDFNRASDPTRRIGGNVSGTWGAYTLSVTADRNDRFFDETTMVTTGALPRVAFSLGERPIGRLPLYVGVASDYAGIQQRRSRDGIVDSADDLGLTRMEVSPSLRMPLSRWPFLSINTSVAWRGIWWSESLVPQAVDGEPLDGTRTQAAEPIGRSYFDLQARITGPVFHRIFDTPKRAYAQRFKHVIEPSLVIRGTTDIEGKERIVRLQSEDFVLSNGAQVQYALTNRLYAKRERAREILMATLFQTYYTDETAVDADPQYRSSFSGLRPASFSAVALHVRARPSDRISADVRTEWDHHVRAIGTLAASGTIQTAWLQAAAGWSQRRHIPDLPGFERDRAVNSLNASTHVRSTLNRVGGMYEFTLDLQQATAQNQRIVAYYNAQCCGVVAEYQVRGRFGVAAGAPQDRRFNVSFSLAGIGTFSNLLGALGGAPLAR